MAYGYSGNTPSYGYQKTGGSPLVSPYYKAAQMLKNSAGLFGNGLIQGESKADSPFTNLASSGATTVKPKAPSATYTQDQVAASLAANPNASKGGYEGAVPLSDLATGGPVQAPASVYDYRTDPILQEINALSTQSRQGAETGALALKKQLAIKYGDKQLGTQIGDPLTAQAAEQNPYSVFGQLKQMFDTGAHNLDESENRDNLFYSGHRILGQQDLANQYQGQLASATGNEQDALGQIDSNRLAAILGADQNDIAAQRDASDRAIQAALAGGYSFGGYNADGTPILTAPAAAPPAAAPTASAAAPATAPSGGDSLGGSAQIGTSTPVGQTTNDLIYQLLGRKTDPRYQF